MSVVRRWVCYDANGVITHRRNASMSVAAYGDNVLEYDLADIPGNEELIVDRWRVNVTGAPTLEERPAMPVSVEQLPANRISSGGLFVITFTIGASPIRCLIPGQSGFIEDADGIIEWSTDEAGLYRFRFEHGLYLSHEQIVEAI